MPTKTGATLALMIAASLVGCVTPAGDHDGTGTPDGSEPDCAALFEEAEAALGAHGDLAACDEGEPCPCMTVIIDVPCANGSFTYIARANEAAFHAFAAEAFAEVCASGCGDVAYDAWDTELECHQGRCRPAE